jgi:catechol 2,3-dioxygenase-like lactoylglutathione lyase family enzyme
VGGIAEVVLSTFDIDRASAAMIEVGGFRRVNLPDGDERLAQAWRVPEGCSRIEQALLLPPVGERGALRLVCFHGLERDYIRPSQRSWDTGGIFDVDIFSRDVRGTYRRLQRMGWGAFGEPVDYEMDEFDVTQVVATGPDGLVLAIIEPHKPPTFDLPFEAMSRVFNSTQMVRDMDAAIAFYCGTLGWTALVDLTIDDSIEPGADVLGMPMPMARTTKRRVVIVHPEGVNDGSVELIEIVGWEGRDYSERAMAPNVGLLALRLPVASVDDYADAILARGGALHVAPCSAEIAPYGEVRLFSVRAPDGAILEFYEEA